MKPPSKPPMTARVAKRLQVLKLLDSDDKLSNCEIGRRTGVTEGVVRYIKDNGFPTTRQTTKVGRFLFQRMPNVQDVHLSTHPGVHYHLCWSLFNVAFVFRYKRMILKLAKKHPFWGTKKISEKSHERQMKYLQPGARVCICTVITPMTLSFS